jgi:CheY-like chemotaxis protein
MAMKSSTLLCVDDDAGIRELYEVMLTSFGYEVLLAEDGNSALELFHSKPNSIAAVILDYQMPEMNGLELAAELKRFRPNLPIVMISGSNPGLEKRPGCVDAALPKGVETEKLVAKLETLLATARAAGKRELPPRAAPTEALAVPS